VTEREPLGKTMGESKPVRAVTFDAVGTLIEPWPSVGHVYSAAAEACGFGGLEPDLLSRRFAKAWKVRRAFDFSRRAWFHIVQSCFEGLLQTPELDRVFPVLYERFGRGSAWRIPPDVLPCLEALKARGIRLAVVSNFDDRLAGILGELRMTRFFDVVLVSGPLGRHKPDPAIFERVCRHLMIPPGEVVHIGDQMDEDVTGARNAGMEAVLVDRGGDTTVEAVPRIRALGEVLELKGFQFGR